MTSRGKAMETYKQLMGARIRSIREVQGLTQEMLAEKMDINPVYLSTIERGRANPTLNMLIKVAVALEVEMWELFDFGHEVGADRLREMLNEFADEIDEGKLKLAVKVWRAIAR